MEEGAQVVHHATEYEGICCCFMQEICKAETHKHTHTGSFYNTAFNLKLC